MAENAVRIMDRQVVVIRASKNVSAVQTRNAVMWVGIKGVQISPVTCVRAVAETVFVGRERIPVLVPRIVPVFAVAMVCAMQKKLAVPVQGIAEHVKGPVVFPMIHRDVTIQR